ncbi:MAG: hypothetical protein WBL68_02980 [Nitrososphaeraceae archaeon]
MDESIQGLNYLDIAAIPKLVKDKLNSPVICINDNNMAVNFTNKLKKVVLSCQTYATQMVLFSRSKSN